MLVKQNKEHKIKILQLLITFVNVFAASLVNHYEDVRYENKLDEEGNYRLRLAIRDINEYLRLFNNTYPNFNLNTLEETQLESDIIIKEEFIKMKSDFYANNKIYSLAIVYTYLCHFMLEIYLETIRISNGKHSISKHEIEFTLKIYQRFEKTKKIFSKDFPKIQTEYLTIKESLYGYISESTTGNA